MTTPADELRAAAKKLREAASAASPAPWTVNSWGGVQDAGDQEMAEVWPLSAPPGANAAYIALMGPSVGQALAQWLDTAAANAAVLTWPNDFIAGALAVARQINGDAR